MINNINSYIRNAPVGVKIKLISSIFPEKIEFAGKTYRTNSYNKVLDLIYQQTNELRGVEKKSGESISTFSASVPLSVLFSNQFLHDLNLIWELRDFIPNPNKLIYHQAKNT